jgi:hypothetical protein
LDRGDAVGILACMASTKQHLHHISELSISDANNESLVHVLPLGCDWAGCLLQNLRCLSLLDTRLTRPLVQHLVRMQHLVSVEAWSLCDPLIEDKADLLLPIDGSECTWESLRLVSILNHEARSLLLTSLTSPSVSGPPCPHLMFRLRHKL